jgi:hypothetical protein
MIMIKLAFSSVFAAALLAAPVTPMAAPAEAPMVMAQVDVQIGPGGVRVGGDRDRDYDRYERRGDRFDRDRRERRDFVRGDRCRTTIVRRETPYGTKVRRIRECD